MLNRYKKLTFLDGKLGKLAYINKTTITVFKTLDVSWNYQTIYNYNLNIETLTKKKFPFFHISKHEHDKLIQELKKYVTLRKGNTIPNIYVENWDNLMKKIKYEEKKNIANQYVLKYNRIFKDVKYDLKHIYLVTRNDDLISDDYFTKEYFELIIIKYIALVKYRVYLNKKILKGIIEMIKELSILKLEFHNDRHMDIYFDHFGFSTASITIPDYIKKESLKTLKNVLTEDIKKLFLDSIKIYIKTKPTKNMKKLKHISSNSYSRHTSYYKIPTFKNYLLYWYKDNVI